MIAEIRLRDRVTNDELTLSLMDPTSYYKNESGVPERELISNVKEITKLHNTGVFLLGQSNNYFIQIFPIEISYMIKNWPAWSTFSRNTRCNYGLIIEAPFSEKVNIEEYFRMMHNKKNQSVSIEFREDDKLLASYNIVSVRYYLRAFADGLLYHRIEAGCNKLFDIHNEPTGGNDNE